MAEVGFDIRLWAPSLLSIAYDRALDPEFHREHVELIVGYFEQASLLGINPERARQALHNEILDIAPVIEPFTRVLKRTLKSLR